MSDYINSWDEVKDGTVVVEDTYPEIYVIFTKDGSRYLRHIGWQTRKMPERKLDPDRKIDFEPNATYDQPWFWLGMMIPLKEVICKPDNSNVANPSLVDVHTEHCCQRCGCEYGKDKECSVSQKLGPQNSRCEGCEPLR